MINNVRYFCYIYVLFVMMCYSANGIEYKLSKETKNNNNEIKNSYEIKNNKNDLIKIDDLLNFNGNCDGLNLKVNKNERLYLRDLMKICICNNPDLKAEYLNIEIAKEKKRQSKSKYFPDISILASTNSEYYKHENNGHGSDDLYSVRLQASWLIYDFGTRKAENDASSNAVDINSFVYSTKLQDKLLSLNEIFLKLLGAKEILVSAKENEKTFKKSYEESSKKYNIGMASLNDKLQAKTQHKESILEIVDAENTIKQYSGDLAELLNVSPTTAFNNLVKPIVDNDITKLNVKDDVNLMIELAIKNRSEIKEMEKKLEYYKNELIVAEGGLKPSVNVSGYINYNDGWQKNSEYTKNSAINLNVNVPLFAGFSNVSKISQVKYEYKQVEYSLETKKNEIKKEVWSKYNDYKKAIKSYEISQQVLASAEENLKVATSSYSIGKIDIINLLTANSKLADARKEKITNFYNVLISKANLYRAIGGGIL